MTMNTTVISNLAALEAVLKQDLFQTAGTPVMTFLEATETAAQNLAANPEPSAAEITQAAAAETAAWVTLQAGILGSAPNLGAEVVLALAQFVMGKVQSVIANATPTPVPAATPTK